MRSIIWTGPERLTRWGLGIEGNKLEMPEDVARSYVEQGLAKYADSKLIGSNEEESE